MGVHLEEIKEHICILPSQRPFCPMCTSFSTLWKIGIGLHVILMVTFALTLLLGTMSLNRAVIDGKLARDEIIIANNKTLDTVRQHIQYTMENRVVQSEVRGMLSSWIEERRKDKISERK